MKRILLVIIIAACPLVAKAWRPDFSLNKNVYSLGMMGGVIGYGTEHQNISFGANVTIGGVSVDFLAYGSEHLSTPEEQKWNDKESFVVNVGYHIPLCKYVRVYPLVGLSERSNGVTDGSKYKMIWDTDDISQTRFNDYTRTQTMYEFNYGGGIAITPLRWLTIHLVASRYAMYGGIGLNLSRL